MELLEIIYSILFELSDISFDKVFLIIVLMSAISIFLYMVYVIVDDSFLKVKTTHCKTLKKCNEGCSYKVLFEGINNEEGYLNVSKKLFDTISDNTNLILEYKKTRFTNNIYYQAILDI